MSITREHRQESLSVGYVHCVAAMAGWTWSVRNLDYGADVTLHHIIRKNHYLLESGTFLDLQLKSTTTATAARGDISFDLPVSNYEWLRQPTVQFRRLLVVLILPQDETEWLTLTEQALTVRHAMYWMSLEGRPATSNKRTIRIQIPRENLFSPGFLNQLQRVEDDQWHL